MVYQPQPLPYQMPLNIAHRGARSVAPENTLIAAQRAYDLGADQWELDVQETRDGELVVLHDPGMARTSDAVNHFPFRPFWQVKNYTLEEVRQLDFGSWFLKRDPFGEIARSNLSIADQETIRGSIIPTLREALALTAENNWAVNIEIKDVSHTPADQDIVQKTVALVEELGMADRVLISSFKLEYLVQVKALNPAIKTGALVTKLGSDPIALLKSIGADAINPDYKSVVDLKIIKTLRDAGFDVYLWTINDEQTMIKFINAGASGIITDYPQRMEKILTQYQH